LEALVNITYEHVKDAARALEVVTHLNENNRRVVLDIETTGLDRFKDKLISFQLCTVGETHAYYFDSQFVDILKKLTNDLVLHNFKFDFGFLLHVAGIDLRQVGMQRVLRWRDTMLMHHLLDENAGHSLEEIILNKYADNYKEVFWSTYKNFQDAPEGAQKNYACKDVVYTGKLYLDMVQELSMSGVPDSLVDHVHKLAEALYDTEVHGVRVDLDHTIKVGNELTCKIHNARIAMRNTAPEVELVELDLWMEELEKRKTTKGRALIGKPDFNWDSGKQLQALIYGKLQVKPITKRSKSTGLTSPTLDDAALEELKDAHPLIPMLHNYRGDQKVFGSFIEGTLARQIGGRIYPNFSVNGTTTGRLSSSNPNLQQLPRDGGIRGMYVPEEGSSFISCDYSMLEVVVAAHYSQDPALLKIIYEGASKHDITASALGIDRQLAKTVNFACQYQCSHYKVAAILGVSAQEGMNAWRKYWETYAKEKEVIEECKAKVDAGIPIVNLFGRRRRFPKVFATNGFREAAYRQAYSSLIQGTGADITHKAFYDCSGRLLRSGVGRGLFEIHDELLIEARDNDTAEAKKILIESMVNAGKILSVPLGVDCSEPMKRWEK
jgi:DNA polymerase-1